MLYESQNASKMRIKKIFAVVSLIVASSLLASCRLRQNSLSQPTTVQDAQTISPTNSSTISPRTSNTQTASPDRNSNRGQDRDNNSRQDNNRQDNNRQQNRNRRNNRSHPCRF